MVIVEAPRWRPEIYSLQIRMMAVRSLPFPLRDLSSTSRMQEDTIGGFLIQFQLEKHVST